jgi:hypothetical protein
MEIQGASRKTTIRYSLGQKDEWDTLERLEVDGP